MPITALYAAILAVYFVGLAVRVSSSRGRYRIFLGDGGNPEFLRIVRCHANFAETVPMALILMALAESGGLGPA